MSNEEFTELSGSDQHLDDGVSVICFADFMGVSVTEDGSYFAVIGNEDKSTDDISTLHQWLYDGYVNLTGDGE